MAIHGKLATLLVNMFVVFKYPGTDNSTKIFWISSKWSEISVKWFMHSSAKNSNAGTIFHADSEYLVELSKFWFSIFSGDKVWVQLYIALQLGLQVLFNCQTTETILNSSSDLNIFKHSKSPGVLSILYLIYHLFQFSTSFFYNPCSSSFLFRSKVRSIQQMSI